MKNAPSQRTATNGLLIILSLFVMLHLLIMLGIVPFGYVWGGRLRSSSEMLSFEAISVAINLLMLFVVGVHAGILKVRISRKILKTILWAMFVLFLLNTIGNILSENKLEKMLFTPLTILLSVFSLRLARSKEVEASY